MNIYEKQIQKELDAWHRDIFKPDNIFEGATRAIQKQTRKLVPKKMQAAITAAMEKFVPTVMNATGLFTVKDDTSDLSLAQRDYLILKNFGAYSKTAAAEGALTGAGGLLAGFADLPALLGIQVTFLANAAKLYGFNPDDPTERLFMLYVFQLAYSNRIHRRDCFYRLANWSHGGCGEDIDWQTLQMEYRDYLDIAKLLQMLPVVGTPVGAVANHQLMKRLRDNTMNAYRMRILNKSWRGEPS